MENTPDTFTATEKQNRSGRKPVAEQFMISALGEIAAFTVAIGAVYVSERIFPEQTKAFVSALAKHLGQWRGVAPETQLILSKKLVDLTLMNMGGAIGLGVQFGLHRAHQKDKKTPFIHEAGRLAAGRLMGTATALGSLALLETRAPKLMRETENALSKTLGGSTHNDRFSELFLSNAVQSAGAVIGNAPAQLLYDHLVNSSSKSIQK